MRQKSTTLRTRAGRPDLRFDRLASARLVRGPRASSCEAPARVPLRDRRARSDRRQRACPPVPAPPRALAHAPSPRPRPGNPQLIDGGRRPGQEHDLRAPPAAMLVTLGLVRDHASLLQVIHPALHALAMRAHESRPLHARRRNGAPAHHGRQPQDELLDRSCEPRRPSGVSKPKQVALDRVRPRFQPIITRRDTPARAASPTEQRGHDQPSGLGWERLARRPIPAATRNSATRRSGVLQRHRQRPTARAAHDGQRQRADARGAAGRTRRRRTTAPSGARRPDPRNRG
jgi:hypothetical protein